MDFTTSINTCLVKKYADFSGRASRDEFWLFMVPVYLLFSVASMIDAMYYPLAGSSSGPIVLILFIVTIVPSIAAGARRLHDVGKSGWWQLTFYTIVGVPIVLYWWFSKGTDGNNEYGEDSLSK